MIDSISVQRRACVHVHLLYKCVCNNLNDSAETVNQMARSSVGVSRGCADGAPVVASEGREGRHVQLRPEGNPPEHLAERALRWTRETL